MAAETVVIDVMANFKDKMSPGIDTAKAKADKFENSIKKAQKQVDKLDGDKASVKIDADDRATSKMKKIISQAKEIGGRVFKGTVSIIDKATTPLRAIKNSLFSIKGLIAAVGTGMAANQLIMKPIQLADSYSSAKIGFSTLLGEAGGQNLMNQIDQFAKATPFKTSNTIEQAQRMIAMGWGADSLISDMKVIGDAAAATGKGDEGLQRIVTALAQIKSKGKLSTEELNQLAEAGISAKRYIAEGLGYGSGDKGLAALADDLQKGAVGADAAIQAIMNGMLEYKGMMETTANETVEGLRSQIEDTFEINIFRKWGQDLQEGAKKGLGSVLELLNASEDSIEAFGDQLHDIGSELSNMAADKLKDVIDTILEVADSEEFRNADLGGKINIMWDKVIAEPFGVWWDAKGKPWMIEKMGDFGEGMGSGLSNILKGLLGFNSGDVADDAATIGGSFAKGFLDGFDGSGVWDALKQTIKSAFTDALSILPFGKSADGSSWASAALLGYLGIKGMKLNTSIGDVFGKKPISWGKSSMEQWGTGLGGEALYGFTGTGISGMLGKIGYGLGSGASSAGGLVAAGAGSVAGGIAAGATLYSGMKDIYTGFKSDDANKKSAYGKSGIYKTSGVAAGAAAGAAIGSFFGGIGAVPGALIGAGIGGIGGWLTGENEKKKYEKEVEEMAEATRQAAIEQEQLKYKSQDVKDILKELGPTTEMTAEELEYYKRAVEKAASEETASRFGDLELSMEEIQKLAEKIVLGDHAAAMNTFSAATEDAASKLSLLQSSYESMNKWSWKVGLGLELDEAEIEEYKATVDAMIQQARDYVESEHYKFTAAVSLLVEVGDGTTGQGIIENGDTVFNKMQEEITAYGEELKTAVDKALEDGVISPDQKIKINVDGVEVEMNEVDAITTLQNKINEITEKVNKAMTDAKLQTLQVKYSGVEMSPETYQKFQSELQTITEDAVSNYDEALTVGIAGINLNDELSQEEKDSQIKALVDGYNAKIEEMEVKVSGFQFNTLADTYGTELEEALKGMDLKGTTAEKMQQVMKQAMDDGVDVGAWDSATLSKYLNLEGMEKDLSTAIANFMSDIGKTLPQNFAAGVEAAMAENSVLQLPSGAIYDPMKQAVETDTTNAIKDADLSGAKEAYNGVLAGLGSGKSVSNENGGQIAGLVLGTKTMIEDSALAGVEQADLSGAEAAYNNVLAGFGSGHSVSESGNNGGQIAGLVLSTKTQVENSATAGVEQADLTTATSTLPGDLDNAMKSQITADSFAGTAGTATSAVQSAVTNSFDGTTFSANAKINVTPEISLTSSGATLSASGAASGSGTVQFQVTPFKKANGGFVNGAELSWLGEEGFEEVVIPFAPHRRARALSLFKQTADKLGVSAHADGGFVGRSLSKSAARKEAKAERRSESGSSANPIQVNVGGITIEVKADGNAGDIITQIRNKKTEISNILSEFLSDALAESFENMPLAD